MTRRRPPGDRAFATSASLLVVFVGFAIAAGALYSVTANTQERLHEARDDAREHHREVRLTAIDVTDATWDGGAANLTLRIENTGETTLSVADADTVVDGTYVGVDGYERVAVEGHRSDLWRPGEELVLEDADTVAGFPSAPDRVAVVTGPGVSDAAEVATT